MEMGFNNDSTDSVNQLELLLYISALLYPNSSYKQGGGGAIYSN